MNIAKTTGHRIASGLVCLGVVTLASPIASVRAQPFYLPTGNRALFDPGNHPEQYFVGTMVTNWTSGIFGCVRSQGQKFHEGLDIRCVDRDRRGEPIDPVMATADGTVVYINARPGLSNFGNYIILRHLIEGLEVYSTYAHLVSVRADLKPGQEVRAGESIGVMGRTANTKEGISKERAHVHFELGLLLNDRFGDWHKRRFPGNRNDHGHWNGQTLIGLDPWLLLVAPWQHYGPWSLTALIRNQTALCRVVVRRTHFPWLRRYARLVQSNPKAASEGVAGYEIALNYAGVPFEMIPRAPSEIPDSSPVQLLWVNEEEQANYSCRKLVTKAKGRWQLSPATLDLLDLLTYEN